MKSRVVTQHTDNEIIRSDMKQNGHVNIQNRINGRFNPPIYSEESKISKDMNAILIDYFLSV